RAQYPIAKAPTMDSPGSSGFCGETAARIPWRASTTTAGPTNGNALSCAGSGSIGIASGKPWNPWAVKNPRPRSGLGAIVGAPQCFWVFIIDCGVECQSQTSATCPKGVCFSTIGLRDVDPEAGE